MTSPLLQNSVSGKNLSTPETTELKEMNWKEFKKEGKRWEEKASIEEVKR